MRRQYAEALKYCRLILQYEPHNATARGFYPLLRHKVQALKRNGESPSDFFKLFFVSYVLKFRDSRIKKKLKSICRRRTPKAVATFYTFR